MDNREKLQEAEIKEKEAHIELMKAQARKLDAEAEAIKKLD